MQQPNPDFPGSAWTTELRVYWATLEGRVFRDIDKSITQWEKVILDQGSDPYRWCQYAECLQNLVGIDRVRTIYKRAANCLIDSASATSLFNAWLLFERISGDLCGFEEARRRQTTKLTALVEREQREKENQQEIQSKRKQRSNEHNLKRKTSSTKPTRPAKRKKGTEGDEGLLFLLNFINDLNYKSPPPHCVCSPSRRTASRGIWIMCCSGGSAG